MTPAQRKLVDIKLYTRQPESATTHPISEELLSRLDDCRHLLPAPGPSMVGQLISEIRRLRGVLKSSFAAGGSDADRDFEAWWARNCYTVRDMLAGEVAGSSGRLRNACLKVWSASREHPNDQVQPTADGGTGGAQKGQPK